MSLPILPPEVCEGEERKEKAEALSARKAGINPLKGPPMRPARVDEDQDGRSVIRARLGSEAAPCCAGAVVRSAHEEGSSMVFQVWWWGD